MIKSYVMKIVEEAFIGKLNRRITLIDDCYSAHIKTLEHKIHDMEKRLIAKAEEDSHELYGSTIIPGGRSILFEMRPSLWFDFCPSKIKIVVFKCGSDGSLHEESFCEIGMMSISHVKIIASDNGWIESIRPLEDERNVSGLPVRESYPVANSKHFREYKKINPKKLKIDHSSWGSMLIGMRNPHKEDVRVYLFLSGVGRE